MATHLTPTTPSTLARPTWWPRAARPLDVLGRVRPHLARRPRRRAVRAVRLAAVVAALAVVAVPCEILWRVLHWVSRGRE